MKGTKEFEFVRRAGTKELSVEKIPAVTQDDDEIVHNLKAQITNVVHGIGTFANEYPKDTLVHVTRDSKSEVWTRCAFGAHELILSPHGAEAKAYVCVLFVNSCVLEVKPLRSIAFQSSPAESPSPSPHPTSIQPGTSLPGAGQYNTAYSPLLCYSVLVFFLIFLFDAESEFEFEFGFDFAFLV